MNNHQLATILQSNNLTKKYFQGVYALDTLPSQKDLKYPFAIICNTAVISHPGKHWVAIFCNKSTDIPEYFDSYGLQPNQTFKIFLGKRFLYQTKHIQQIASSICGEYCLYFIYHKCLSYSLKNIIAPFTKNQYKNDKYVIKIICKIFRVCSAMYNRKFIYKQLSSSLKTYA